MNEFEKEMLSFMKEINNEIKEIKKDISELKETAEITRVATNYNGEKLECLLSELKHSNIIA